MTRHSQEYSNDGAAGYCGSKSQSVSTFILSTRLLPILLPYLSRTRSPVATMKQSYSRRSSESALTENIRFAYLLTHTHTHTHIHTHMYVCVYIYIKYIHVCVCVCVCVRRQELGLRTNQSILKMEAEVSSEMSLTIYQNTR